MPSPDVSNYVDLTLFDLESQQIYLNALQYARIALPEYQPIEGSVETVLLQAMALEVQELVTAINRLPNGIVQALLGILGAPRFDGVRATGIAKFTANTSVDNNETLPAGVRLFFREDSTAEPTITTTDASISISRRHPLAGLSTTGTQNLVTATTVDYHGLEADQIVALDGPNVGSLTTQAIYVTSPTVSGYLDPGYVQVATVLSSTSFTYRANILGNSVPATTLTFANTSNYYEVSSELDPYGYGAVTAATGGSRYIAAGTQLTPLTSIPRIATVEMASDLDNGRDPEDDAAYFRRATAILGRMTSALVTADQIAQYIASSPEFSYVYRVKAIDNCDSDRVLATPGATLVVLAKLGATNDIQIDNTSLTAIEDAVAAYTHPALTVTADNALLATVSVEVDLAPTTAATESTVREGVSAALSAYLSADTWDWSNVVRRNELVAVVRNATYDGVPVVSYVNDVTITPTDGNFSSLTMAQSGTFTRTIASGVATITTSSAHGLTIDSDHTVYVALALTAGGYGLFAIKKTGTTTSTSFQVDDPDGTIAASDGWAPIATRSDGVGESGDLEFFDPAPLVRSGQHSITIS